MKQLSQPYLFSLLITLLVPLVLILTTVRLMLHPWFLVFEYNTPNFPADPYGFTFVERLDYGKYALNYLVLDVPIDYLAALKFKEGVTAPPESCAQMEDCTFLFNERELSHMVDVKHVTVNVLKIWRALLIVLAVMAIFALRKGWLSEFKTALGRGGWLTVILCAFILLGVVAAFGFIFVAFHDVFFAAGTWMFFTSDTLIRLFPERFWRDVFLYAFGIPGLLGLLLGLWLSPKN